MLGLVFSWDSEKDASNQKKHRVSFLEAKSVFEDELARLVRDPDHSNGEERFVLMGMSKKGRFLVVHHGELDGDVIRIISARMASRIERRQVEGFRYA